MNAFLKGQFTAKILCTTIVVRVSHLDCLTYYLFCINMQKKACIYQTKLAYFIAQTRLEVPVMFWSVS